MYVLAYTRGSRSLEPRLEFILGRNRHSLLGGERIPADCDFVDAEGLEFGDDAGGRFELAPAGFRVAMERSSEIDDTGVHIGSHRGGVYEQ
ncbi:hypothetical protein C482_02556 [Natrialba chahannaoensis JCM 10990]|uniref:Uncharacterized protein n=1 Tax=Natrialba chahannaoensis JCM 10990 TaxID=1227492 RepID=M0B5V3_9EURY|nr:hypothetical protein C482_02556 [Natrialba chahannaoensis JCM 10990]